MEQIHLFVLACSDTRSTRPACAVRPRSSSISLKECLHIHPGPLWAEADTLSLLHLSRGTHTFEGPDSEFAVRDELGRMPLHYAVVNGSLDIVEEVLARSERVGISIDVKDNDGWTPLLWRARASTTFRQLYPTNPTTTDMVSFLSERGADPTIERLGFSAPSPASQIAYYSGVDDYVTFVSSNPLANTLHSLVLVT